MSTESGKRVLITFGRSFLALQLARLFQAGGHRVYTADSLHFPISRFSNSTADSFLVARPSHEPVAWAQDLARIAREHHIDLVVTVHEETDILAAAVRRHPGLFPAECELFLLDFEQVDRLDNKFAFQEMLRSMGVPTLPYALVDTEAKLAELEIPGPFALKHCYSRGAQDVLKVSPGETPRVAFDPQNPWLAQGWAEGPRYCTYSICRDGQVLAHTLYPVNYAIDGRSSLYYEHVEHDGLAGWVRDRVKAINFSGQIGFDFVDTADGLFAIECNPRATSGLLLFSREDRVDRAFLGAVDPGEPVITPKPGVRRMLGPGMLLYGWRKSALPGNTLRGFLRDARAADEVITSRSDPLPALALPLAMADILGQSIRYRVGFPEGFMHDHEWDGVPLPE
ncbi:ATP-grasp domain-containing protein [Tomitella biformata]|uniref:ATP-grasp domain-containing protein n=1 Tax=Tomitella biformata TaxID=630403 RepID=UPI000466977C|nr:ATP-grasp domain-containing protein [Tomitella biformata]